MDAVFLKLLQMGWSAGILALVVMALRGIFKKAPKWISCLLWGLVALRLICPVVIQSPLSLLPQGIGSGQSIAHRIEGAALPDTQELLPDDGQTAVITDEQPQPAAEADGSLPVGTKKRVWLPVLAKIWLLGVLLMMSYMAWSYWRVRRQVAASIRTEDDLWICDHLPTPFILGIVHPRIYIPSGISEAEKAAIAAHERAHLRRRDHWWKPLGFVLLAIYWFHPVLWAAYILLCRDIELACDEKVIQEYTLADRKAYSEALLMMSTGERYITACPLAFGEIGVKERVRTVMNYRKPAFWIVVVALIACAAAAVCFLTEPQRTDGMLMVDGRCYTQLEDKTDALPRYAVQIGTLMDIDGQQPTEDFHGSGLNKAYIGAPVYQKDARRTELYLETEDKILHFACEPIRTIGDGVQRWELESTGAGSRSAEVCLTEYPDVIFALIEDKICAINKNGTVILLNAAPTDALWFADADGDGLREVCASIASGSGNAVVINSYGRDDMYYELAAPDVYDYRLTEKKGELMLEKIDHATQTQISSVPLAEEMAARIVGVQSQEEGADKLPDRVQLERAISAAILEKEPLERGDDLIYAESHVILDAAEKYGPVLTGSQRAEKNLLEIYLVMLAEAYDSTQGLTPKGGVGGPVAITFMRVGDEYQMTEYWHPGFGEQQKLDLEQKFSKKAMDKVYSIDTNLLVEENLQKAQKQLEMRQQQPSRTDCYDE